MACPFTIDKTPPNTPTVSSAEYPENPPAPTGGYGQSGTFVFTANGSTDVTQFLYGTSPGSLFTRVNADSQGTATITLTPRQIGMQSLYVVSLDRAHNASPVREYTFNVRSYAVSVWPTGQVPDPAGSRAAQVTLHFTTQAGNGLTTIAYAIDDGTGTSQFDSSITFYAGDEPTVDSDGVYPIDGSGGGVGVTGVFTVTPYLAADMRDVEYFTTQDTTPVDVPVDADGKARVHWTPTQTGWTYFWFTVRYTDGTTSSYHSFSVTVNG